jgi:hypothetical protein
MNVCETCKHALWKRTATSGDGKCQWPKVEPVIPACMYFLGSTQPSGGYINRKTHKFQACPTWEGIVAP